jgi:DNA polymerase III subunit beta
MELVVSTTELAGVLRLVQTLADRKNTLPVLGTLLLRADAKGLSITGTDLETGGIVYCPAIVKAPGSVAVPAQRLSEYVRLLPEGELLLRQQSSGWLSVASGRSRSPSIPSCPNRSGTASAKKSNAKAVLNLWQM